MIPWKYSVDSSVTWKIQKTTYCQDSCKSSILSIMTCLDVLNTVLVYACYFRIIEYLSFIPPPFFFPFTLKRDWFGRYTIWLFHLCSHLPGLVWVILCRSYSHKWVYPLPHKNLCKPSSTSFFLYFCLYLFPSCCLISPSHSPFLRISSFLKPYFIFSPKSSYVTLKSTGW